MTRSVINVLLAVALISSIIINQSYAWLLLLLLGVVCRTIVAYSLDESTEREQS